MPQLVIIRGLPGSGKSTLAKERYGDYLHYEPDHLFSDTNGKYRFDAQLWPLVTNLIYHLVDYALARGENVVISDVFPTLASIQPYIDLAKHYEYECIITETHEQFKNVHRVPVTVLKKMKEQWEEL